MLGKCFHRDRKANLELKALRCQLVGTDFGSARSSWIQSSLQCHGHDWVSSTKLGNSKAKKWKVSIWAPCTLCSDTSVMCAVGVRSKPSCPGFKKLHIDSAASASMLHRKLWARLWPSQGWISHGMHSCSSCVSTACSGWVTAILRSAFLLPCMCLTVPLDTKFLLKKGLFGLTLLPYAKSHIIQQCWEGCCSWPGSSVGSMFTGRPSPGMGPSCYSWIEERRRHPRARL